MAFTILNNPQVWSPVYSPLEFEVLSDDFVHCNFEYIADIYVNGVLVDTLNREPNLNNTAVFEVNTIIQNYISYDLAIDTQFASSVNSFVSYYISFGMRYNTTGTCDGSTTLFTDQLITDTYYTWNGTLTIEDYWNYDQDDFVYAGVPVRFLSTQPKTVTISEGDYSQLSYIQVKDTSVSPAANQFIVLQVNTYDINKNLIGSYKITNNHPNLDNVVMSVGTGWANIVDSQLNGSLTAYTGSTLPVFKPSVAYYDVAMADASDTPVTEVKTFRINRELEITPIRFMFLGRLGNMDSYTFTKTYTLSENNTKTEFTKLNSSHDPSLRGRTNISVDVIEKYSAQSNNMTESEGKFLKELVASLEAYTIHSPEIYCVIRSYTSIETHHLALEIANPNNEDLSSFEGQSLFIITGTTSFLATVNTVEGNTLFTNSSHTGGDCGIFVVGGEKGTGGTIYTPIIITTKDFEVKQSRTVSNINSNITFEKANGLQIQRQ